jgi:hypothetical protein
MGHNRGMLDPTARRRRADLRGGGGMRTDVLSMLRHRRRCADGSVAPPSTGWGRLEGARRAGRPGDEVASGPTRRLTLALWVWWQ